MMSTQMSQHLVAPFQRAGRVSANPDDAPPHWLIVEQRVELDHTVDFDQWHMQRPGNFRGDFLGRHDIR